MWDTGKMKIREGIYSIYLTLNEYLYSLALTVHFVGIKTKHARGKNWEKTAWNQNPLKVQFEDCDT